MEKTSGWDFWRFCFRLGFREIIRGVDYFRFYEFPTFYEWLDLKSGVSVLDLGCGRSLFPLYSAYYHPEISYTTLDIDPVSIDWQSRLRHRLRLTTNLFILRGDSAGIGLEENSFDRVANLGSIEHIPEEGDIQTAREMGRVCRPGGFLILSIPYSEKGIEQGATDHWKGFERRYDEQMLEDRLIGPSGCRLVKKRYFGEPGFQFSRVWYRLPFLFRVPLRHLAPLASTRWLAEIPAERRAGACGVQLLLQKPQPEQSPSGD